MGNNIVKLTVGSAFVHKLVVGEGIRNLTVFNHKYFICGNNR